MIKNIRYKWYYKKDNV